MIIIISNVKKNWNFFTNILLNMYITKPWIQMSATPVKDVPNHTYDDSDYS